jgi:hypothetical protein
VPGRQASVACRIYSLLTDGKLELPLKRKLVRIIPAEWKEAWAHLLPCLDKDFQSLWHISGLRDLTSDIEEFDSFITSGNIRKIVLALNKYPIEQVIVFIVRSIFCCSKVSFYSR